MHVVIIGGGFGGLTTAHALRGEAVRVTLVDRWNHHLFQPLLYQVAMAGLSPADIAYPIRSALRDQENARVLLAEVVGVDLAARRLTLLDGAELGYDTLVVSIGVKNNYFGHEDTWAKYAFGLKTLDEAVEIRRRVLLAFEAAEREQDAAAKRRLLTFVVIGGGPTGVEVAGALSELARTVLADDFREIRPESTRVVLVERGDRLLSGGFDPKLGVKAKQQLEELGVEVRLGVTVENIDARGVHTDAELFDSANVLWTAGVRGRSFAEKLGVPLDRMGRIVVAQDCSVPGHPELFAIGDIACFTETGAERPLPGVAPVAMQQGRFVAAEIVRRASKKPPGHFHYVDKGIMATVGRSRAVLQSGPVRLSGLLAWLGWLFVHIIYLIGFRNRFVVLFSWMWSYVTYRRGARLITGDRSWARLGEFGVVHERPAAAAPDARPEAPQGNRGA